MRKWSVVGSGRLRFGEWAMHSIQMGSGDKRLQSDVMVALRSCVRESRMFGDMLRGKISGGITFAGRPETLIVVIIVIHTEIVIPSSLLFPSYLAIPVFFLSLRPSAHNHAVYTSAPTILRIPHLCSAPSNSRHLLQNTPRSFYFLIPRQPTGP